MSFGPESGHIGAETHGPAVETHGSARRAGRFIAGTGLNLAAVGGVVCLVLVVMAVGFNLTLIMFRTGSMGPGIPAGSVALVHEIAASEIRVGDVVTVDRAGALPITHRVTSVTTLPEAPAGADISATSGGAPLTQPSEARVITLKGDANTAADPAPYTVTLVRIVLASVPGLAVVVVWFSNPWVLAALAVGAAVLVTWAFWPRDERDDADRDDDRDGSAADSPQHPDGRP
ncbi:S26 family signal peptidase [Cryobacterium sp. PH31-L1]|uniref:S26 family signal peptidase n=1 Tax=Cryobacterium sp. PH31-L1 TaxID=3046199 RepID=UPI0024BB2AF1|nr:S26 family signal peptidase [Cryobacterium sp. PH31-L1]MDJ0376918.1 S26 family signal peptidase [Cryobacterium sp. PH31-L1]